MKLFTFVYKDKKEYNTVSIEAIDLLQAVLIIDNDIFKNTVSISSHSLPNDVQNDAVIDTTEDSQ